MLLQNTNRVQSCSPPLRRGGGGKHKTWVAEIAGPGPQWKAQFRQRPCMDTKLKGEQAKGKIAHNSSEGGGGRMAVPRGQRKKEATIAGL